MTYDTVYTIEAEEWVKRFTDVYKETTGRVLGIGEKENLKSAYREGWNRCRKEAIAECEEVAEECAAQVEEARILGRTEAVEFVGQLADAFRNDERSYKRLNRLAEAYILKECADRLEEKIDDFARTK